MACDTSSQQLEVTPVGQACPRVAEDWCVIAFSWCCILLLLIGWGLAELFVAIKVAEAIGVLETVLLSDRELAARSVGAPHAGPRGVAPPLGGGRGGALART